MNTAIKTSIRRSMILLVSASALVACSKLAWETTFSAENAYATHGTVSAVGINESSFLSGYTNADADGLVSRRGFVVKYDGKGNPEWNRVLEHEAGLVSLGVQALLPDAEGNVYVANTLLDEVNARFLLSVSKLDALGATLWNWQGESSGMLASTRDMYLGFDGNIYIRSGAVLHSLTPGGEFRFDLSAPVNPGSQQSCMGWYLDWVIDRNAFEVVNNPNNLRIVNFNTDAQLDVPKECLGFSEISQTEVVNGDVFVLGRLANQDLAFKVFRQSEDMMILDRSVVGILPVTGGNTLVSRHGQNGFCFASLDEQSRLSTGFIDTQLQVKWTNRRTLTGVPERTQLGDVVNANNACYVQYIESHANDKVSSVVVIENEDTGKQSAKINTDHVVVWDIAVGDRYLMQSGIKGSYTTEEGMAAYLSKAVVN